MKEITVITISTQSSPHHISAIMSLTEGKSLVHYHDATAFTTRFHPWFTQFKKRTGKGHLKTSRFAISPEGLLYDGKQLPEKKPNPAGFYTIFWPVGAKAGS